MKNKWFAVEGKISETFRLGALLACVGGFMDAYSYVTRGNVFATAETGNIVLMGINLAQGNLAMVLHYLIPICVYAFGIFVTKFIHALHDEHGVFIVHHWRQTIIGIEILVLVGVMFIPDLPKYDLAANVLIAFVSSMQVQSFRKLRGNGFATTMCTGNLRSGMDMLYRAIRNRNPKQGRMCLRYFGIIGCFVLGVVVSVKLTGVFGTHAMPFAITLLIIVFIMLIYEPENAA